MSRRTFPIPLGRVGRKARLRLYLLIFLIVTWRGEGWYICKRVSTNPAMRKSSHAFTRNTCTGFIVLGTTLQMGKLGNGNDPLAGHEVRTHGDGEGNLLHHLDP